ncbi:hypothetical protein FB566_2016 [Stackebrandtia endophytica]|uniref:Uncharacterized protein n=1 Tax=Stackebrandtia endophytica TaxID=1496996 RepID=A0A543AVB3_9ACTN|nr:hypothetical protein [Stackebrandtia endophytica]TQL76484.1 hypothetical protein FB566_2016 [Stackebrandtia endophytica]
MDEPRIPRARSDDSDDIVAAAFASYRSGAPEHFDPPPVTALMTGPARAPRRRALTLSMAGLAFTGLMVAGVAVAQTITIPQSEDPAVAGAETTTDTGSVDHLSTTSAPEDSSTSLSTEPDPVENELLSWTISLPDWPGRLAERCPAGEYTFEAFDKPDGTTSNKPRNTPSPGEEETEPTWELLPGGTHPMVTDLDGEEGDEVIVPVACGDVPGVIALYQDEKSFGTVEFVFAASREDDPIGVASVDDTIVTLSFPAEEPGTADLRQFTFDGEQFTETTEKPGGGEEPTDTPSTSPSEQPSPSPSETESQTPGGDTGGDSGETGASQTNSENMQSRNLESSASPS